jgi:CDP-diacylglycerol--serine O-phosphatidyltransferase
MFCGFYSVASTLRENFDAAAIAIGVGAVLDMLDGRIARMTHTSSDFGLQLDSLADLLTFGVAPAVLALYWGIPGAGSGLPPDLVEDLYKFGWLASFGFLIAGALRLARFNVLTLTPGGSAASKSHYVGLPIPPAAGVVAAVVHFWKTPVTGAITGALVCVLLIVLAFLMISTVRYPSFKDADLRKPLPRTALVGTAMLLVLIFFFSDEVLVLLAAVYVASGPVGRAVPAIRGFLGGSSRRSPPKGTSPGSPMRDRERHGDSTP